MVKEPLHDLQRRRADALRPIQALLAAIAEHQFLRRQVPEFGQPLAGVPGAGMGGHQLVVRGEYAHFPGPARPGSCA